MRQKNPRISKREFFFSKKVGKAIAAYEMIKEGDRVLIAVSGGRSSLSLLQVLRYKQGRLPVKFDILAYYIDRGLDNARCNLLERFFEDNNYDYIIEKRDCKPEELNTVLLEAAKKKGFNKIALGHNKDDIAVELFFNLFFHGKVGSVEPTEVFLGESLKIIRPLAFCEEHFINNYANANNFPELRTGRPKEQDPKTMVVKNMLGLVSKHNKDAKTNIARSLNNINFDYLP
ncbi:MAG: hypothetical protein HQ572_01060 [Candidatus Omnitrophica bacterium]|nr:hypothetical protein [Candidatus Omnitrophota bacterium]